ncbi:MAG: hypothetical protein ACI9W6_002790 [Motiliproteus sp.]
MRYLLRLSMALLLIGVVALGFMLSMALSDQPSVATPRDTSPQQVYQIKALAQRMLKALKRSSPSTVRVSQAELNSVSSLVARAYPELLSQFSVDPQGLGLVLSLALPNNPFGRYLSLRLHVPIAARQLRIEQLQLGSLRIPDRLLQTLLPRLLDLLFDSGQRETLLLTLRLAQTSPERLTVAIHPPANASEKVRLLLARIQGFSSDKPALDNSRISHYYSLLQQQAAGVDPQQWLSVTQFIAPLFRQLAQQADSEDAHLEAGAALLALAIYLGSPQVEQLTGPVLTEQQRQQPVHNRTLLQGRIDLRQHFAVSAALQVLADAGFSHAIGEFKELLDSRKEGSGFSFADLAADRAGTLFAQRASRDPQQAMAFLQLFEPPLRESDLMIAIDTLPEGLTQAEFQTRYQGLQGKGYLALLERIDTELAELRLYR